MADYSLVKERMVELGEVLEALGYPGPQEVIEGHGAVGKAVDECRTNDKAQVLALYLKDLHQSFATRSPDPEGNKDQAVAAVKAAWGDVRNALSDDPDINTAQLDRDAASVGPATTQPQRPLRPVVANAARSGPTISRGPGMPSIRPGMPSPPRR